MQEFYSSKKNVLQLILLPKYSPDMNPQKNIWSYFKAKLFKPSSRHSIEELVFDVKNIFDELNSDCDNICSLAYVRYFLV